MDICLSILKEFNVKSTNQFTLLELSSALAEFLTLIMGSSPGVEQIWLYSLYFHTKRRLLECMVLMLLFISTSVITFLIPGPGDQAHGRGQNGLLVNMYKTVLSLMSIFLQF